MGCVVPGEQKLCYCTVDENCINVAQDIMLSKVFVNTKWAFLFHK